MWPAKVTWHFRGHNNRHTLNRGHSEQEAGQISSSHGPAEQSMLTTDKDGQQVSGTKTPGLEPTNPAQQTMKMNPARLALTRTQKVTLGAKSKSQTDCRRTHPQQ